MLLLYATHPEGRIAFYRIPDQTCVGLLVTGEITMPADEQTDPPTAPDPASSDLLGGDLDAWEITDGVRQAIVEALSRGEPVALLPIRLTDDITGESTLFIGESNAILFRKGHTLFLGKRTFTAEERDWIEHMLS
jgi:hypothetical protein